MTVETRQFAVKDILTELVEKEQGMASALMDFCTSDDEIDDERLACKGRVCQILDALHTSTVVIATASKRKAKAPAGGSSTNTTHPGPLTCNLGHKSTVEELAAYQPNQVLSAAGTSRQDLVADHAVPELLAGLAQASATRSDLTLERVAHAL